MIKLTKEHFKELLVRGYSLDQIFILMMIKEGNDMSQISADFDSMKFEALYQSLIRKALITDAGLLTISGQELLDFMTSKIAVKMVKKKTGNKDFDDWWSTFPLSDHFEYKGRIFIGSRTMRVQKDKCMLKFNSLVNEGEFTAAEIIEGTKYLVDLKKENSFKKKSNELTYLNNSYTFLSEKLFRPFIGLKQLGVPITDSPIGGGVDI
jgi:hypothetical protein